VNRHFHGELEEAALWSKALGDSEIAALSASRPAIEQNGKN
jgi:hypothetical protein